MNRFHFSSSISNSNSNFFESIVLLTQNYFTLLYFPHGTLELIIWSSFVDCNRLMNNGNLKKTESNQISSNPSNNGLISETYSNSFDSTWFDESNSNRLYNVQFEINN